MGLVADASCSAYQIAIVTSVHILQAFEPKKEWLFEVEDLVHDAFPCHPGQKLGPRATVGKTAASGETLQSPYP